VAGAPRPGTPLVGCNPTGKPTREQAIAAHASTGREHAGNLLIPRRMPEVFQLLHYGASGDAPVYDLGFVWRCQLYEAAADVVPVILRDLGWDKADAAARAALATRVDEGILATVVATRPAAWDDAHPFVPPENRALPDGGVERTRWIEQFTHIWGGSIPGYARARVTFTRDGLLLPPAPLDGFKLEPGK
jgi:hypothetical protein